MNVEHVPLAAPGLDAETRVSGVYATELAMQLDKAIYNTRAIDLESLCILAGRKVSLRLNHSLPKYSHPVADHDYPLKVSIAILH